jgi:peptidoglycan hydrolase CwlO-like protein
MNSTIIELAVAVLVSIVSSSAIFTFIQFLIDRKDKRESRYKELESSIQSIRQDIVKLSDKMEENDIRQARTRILRASDEIRRDVKHSQEFFDQLNEDITDYANYCDTHKGFKNNKAVNAIQNINNVYKDALKNNNFL